MAVKSKELIKELVRAGWYLDRINGSHHIFKHPDFRLPLTIPHLKKDLGIGLVIPIPLILSSPCLLKLSLTALLILQVACYLTSINALSLNVFPAQIRPFT